MVEKVKLLMNDEEAYNKVLKTEKINKELNMENFKENFKEKFKGKLSNNF